MPFKICGLVLEEHDVTKMADKLYPNRTHTHYWFNAFLIVEQEMEKNGSIVSAQVDIDLPDPWILIVAKVKSSPKYAVDNLRPLKEGRKAAAVREHLKKFEIEDLEFRTLVTDRTLYGSDSFCRIVDDLVVGI